MTGTAPVALVVGALGRLGSELVPGLERVGWQVVAVDSAELDIRDRAASLTMVEAVAPEVVVDVAAWTDLDLSEQDPDGAYEVNATAVGHLREATSRSGARLVLISTDYVFDGAGVRPYREEDEPNPLSVYGRSKWAGEQAAGPEATIVRTAWLNGRSGRCVARTVLDLARDPTRSLAFVDDQIGSPTVIGDLVPELAWVIAEAGPGTYHLTNAGAASWYEVARAVLASAGHDPDRVHPVATADLDPASVVRRPAYSVLDNAALRALGRPPLPDWRDAIGRLVQELESGTR